MGEKPKSFTHFYSHFNLNYSFSVPSFLERGFFCFEFKINVKFAFRRGIQTTKFPPFINLIIFMRKLFLVLIFFSAFCSVRAQTFDYSKGMHAGLSLITAQNVGPNLGLYCGVEFGKGDQWKFEVTGNWCPFKTKIGEYAVYSDFNSVMVPYDVFLSYQSLNFGARYYFKDVYEEGHNFHLDGGMLLQIFVFDSETSSNEPFVQPIVGGGQFNFGAFVGAGYQYSFESGLILQAKLSYEQKIGTIFSIDSYPVNANSAFIIGAGVKYNFLFNLNRFW